MNYTKCNALLVIKQIESIQKHPHMQCVVIRKRNVPLHAAEHNSGNKTERKGGNREDDANQLLTKQNKTYRGE